MSPLFKIKRLFWILTELLCLPFLILLAAIARYRRKPFDVGIGPEPLINNIYHKAALEAQGYRVQTFVSSVYSITQQFDIRADLLFRYFHLRMFYLFCRAIFSYRILYFYFHGGPLGFSRFLWRFEPILYRLARVKTVVMPYGSDIQDMQRCPNLALRHVMSKDYPSHRKKRHLTAKKIDLWTTNANHIISGCDWVDYLYYWDTLVLSHICIDTDAWASLPQTHESLNNSNISKPLRILHAPNHRNGKGTTFFILAVEELQREGYAVELILMEKVSNDRIKEEIQNADIIADQLIAGFYAMFAIEGMSMGKPVLCYLRQDLVDLYTTAKLVQSHEIPIINANPATVKEIIKALIQNRSSLAEIGKKSREYVIQHHSLASLGHVFDTINKQVMQTEPRCKK